MFTRVKKMLILVVTAFFGCVFMFISPVFAEDFGYITPNTIYIEGTIPARTDAELRNSNIFAVYHMKLDETNIVKFFFRTDDGGNAELKVLNSNGQKMFSESKYSGSDATSDEYTFPPDDYTIEVASSSKTGTYKFKFEEVRKKVVDEAGTSPSSATLINLGEDKIGSFDTQANDSSSSNTDYYTFSIDKDDKITVIVSPDDKMSMSYKLLDENEVKQEERYVPGEAKSETYNLKKGKYYLSLSGSSTGFYNLKVNSENLKNIPTPTSVPTPTSPPSPTVNETNPFNAVINNMAKTVPIVLAIFIAVIMFFVTYKFLKKHDQKNGGELSKTASFVIAIVVAIISGIAIAMVTYFCF